MVGLTECCKMRKVAGGGAERLWAFRFAFSNAQIYHSPPAMPKYAHDLALI
jgi:hypothetical protein